MKPGKIAREFRIDAPEQFRLADHDPAATHGLNIEKGEAKTLLARDIERLAELQERLYAEHRWAVLVVLQAMDAAGKDSVIKHVMSGVNPQGCDVHAFKRPSSEELDHDFLWRAAKRLPQRGRIGIFNRSYYEEVLVVRIHPDLLEAQKLPSELVTDQIWERRFKAIRAFERHLVRNGTLVLKFFLNVSREEQKRRFLARLDDPAKRWKFSMADVEERKLWDRYRKCYEEMIRQTSRTKAPWHVVPADNKWFTRLVVASGIVEALEALDLEFPKIDGPALREMNKVRERLVAEG